MGVKTGENYEYNWVGPKFRQLKTLDFGEDYTNGPCEFFFFFTDYKKATLIIAKLALVVCYECKWLGLGFDCGLTFLASALYSSDSRVRACSFLTFNWVILGINGYVYFTLIKDASKQGRKNVNLDDDVMEVEVEKTLIEIKATKPKAVTIVVTRPKARGVVVQEPSEFTKTTSPSQLSQLPQAKDKGKAKMVEPKKPLKKKDQILIDEEIAQRLQEELQAELEEEERMARQKEEEANITLIES
ncbi:hypothetical protein Tco_0727764 [Tanacetum coccineum]|uniref:Uncharacterized protein n=1 Tax=Tanacetum coccineum TaxID=301880 RepID=A0ABQ4YMA3_9ASTR